MKKGALFLFLIVFAIGIGFWIQRAYQPPRQEIPSPLVVGTSADYKPLAFQENNTIQGFDIDLIDTISQRLGTSYDIRNMPFEFLLYQLQNNSIHVVAAGLSATEKRAEHVNFSDPYIVEDPLVVVTKPEQQDVIQNFDDLTGKTVAVNQGYTAESYMQAFDNIALVRLPSVSEAILALNAGKVDAFVTASHTLQPAIQEYGGDAFHVFPIQDATESISLAISQAYPKLHKQINLILKQLSEEGVIAELKSKWNIS